MIYPPDTRFAKFITRVNAILAEYSAFRRGENCRFVDNGHSAIIAAFRRNTGTQAFGFLVICNFDTVNPQRITIDLASLLEKDGPITCDELLSSETRNFANPRLELALAPSAAQVLKFPR
jgi:hypothetical protein